LTADIVLTYDRTVYVHIFRLQYYCVCCNRKLEPQNVYTLNVELQNSSQSPTPLQNLLKYHSFKLNVHLCRSSVNIAPLFYCNEWNVTLRSPIVCCFECVHHSW